MTPAPEFYSCRTLAERWDCSKAFVWSLVQVGQLAAVRFPGTGPKSSKTTRGEVLRIARATVEEFERENLQPYAPAPRRARAGRRP
jgi:hypothetical protein